MKEAGKGPAVLRLNNEKRVLRYLRQQRVTTRQDISLALALSKNTVSLIIDDLMAQDQVYALGPVSVTAAGRPKIEISLRPEKRKAAGIMVEHQQVHLMVCDYFSTVLEEKSWQTDTVEPPRLLAELATACEALTQRHPELMGIGLGFPGIVDPQKGYLHLSSHLGWRDVDIQAAFAECRCAPVKVMNYVKAAALLSRQMADFSVGDSCFYLRVGEGTGGALLRGSEIFTGSSWTAGEAGHLTVADGPLCRCGQRGCLEALISIPAIHRQLAARQAGLRWQTRAQAPELVEEVMAQAGWHLGKALSQIMLLLNPATIVIDSPWNLSAAFRAQALDNARQHALGFTFHHTQIHFPADPLAPPLGLALAVIEQSEQASLLTSPS
ncbi:ROK family protein [Paramixta manurensis]|uniref:ROK family protein n=1 Tax=Paramixta manurensis TaxID=2740817 RepID=A0A6M8U2V9_9GAMM|nr:ROK family protein [Erwiniaceae bacterium PD-1]